MKKLVLVTALSLVLSACGSVASQQNCETQPRKLRKKTGALLS